MFGENRTLNLHRMWSPDDQCADVANFIFPCRSGFLSRMQFSSDILSSFLFTWVVMVLHDTYFFSIHTLMHYFKSLYRRVHQWHHSTNGDLTVFGTAYGDLFDITFTFAPFYAVLAIYIYFQPTWNPIDLAFLLWAVNGVDMMGHCGYKLPVWVYVPGSFGVLLTPLAQRPKHHYIHHLDPRYNRSLYFTWWDRAAGTFREDHPKVVNDISPAAIKKTEMEKSETSISSYWTQDQMSKAANDFNIGRWFMDQVLEQLPDM